MYSDKRRNGGGGERREGDVSDWKDSLQREKRAKELRL